MRKQQAGAETRKRKCFQLRCSPIIHSLLSPTHKPHPQDVTSSGSYEIHYFIYGHLHSFSLTPPLLTTDVTASLWRISRYIDSNSSNFMQSTKLILKCVFRCGRVCILYTRPITFLTLSPILPPLLVPSHVTAVTHQQHCCRSAMSSGLSDVLFF